MSALWGFARSTRPSCHQRPPPPRQRRCLQDSVSKSTARPANIFGFPCLDPKSAVQNQNPWRGKSKTDGQERSFSGFLNNTIGSSFHWVWTWGDEGLPKWRRRVQDAPRRSGAESRDKVSLLPIVTYSNCCCCSCYQRHQGCSWISDQCVSHHTERWKRCKGRAEASQITERGCTKTSPWLDANEGRNWSALIRASPPQSYTSAQPLRAFLCKTG